jgi:hypothetical protein
VLGIDNPYLLHEIHNRDEVLMKDQMYSQLQRQTNPEDIEMINAQAKKCSLLNGMGNTQDVSPYKSKYTVLKFANTYSTQ